jgi:hypothetical protein
VLPAEAEVTLTDRRPGSQRRVRSGLTAEYRVDGELAGLVSVNDPRAFTALTRTMLAASGPRVAVPQAPAFTDVLTPPGIDLPVAVGGAASATGSIPDSPRPRLYAVR